MGELLRFKHPKARNKDKEEAVNLLKRYLKCVRRGQFNGIGIIAVKDGQIVAGWSQNGEKLTDLTTGAQHLQNMLWMEMYDGNDS